MVMPIVNTLRCFYATCIYINGIITVPFAKFHNSFVATSLEYVGGNTPAAIKLGSESSGLPTLEKGDAVAEPERMDPGERTAEDDMADAEERDRDR